MFHVSILMFSFRHDKDKKRSKKIYVYNVKYLCTELLFNERLNLKIFFGST